MRSVWRTQPHHDGKHADSWPFGMEREGEREKEKDRERERGAQKKVSHLSGKQHALKCEAFI